MSASDSFSIILILFLIFFVGCAVGSGVGYRDMKDQVIERGHMVQCLGKSGYHWECEE